MTLAYKGESVTFDMPGWYSDEESVHTGDDMEVSDRFLRDLKTKVDGLTQPEEVGASEHRSARRSAERA